MPLVAPVINAVFIESFAGLSEVFSVSSKVCFNRGILLMDLMEESLLLRFCLAMSVLGVVLIGFFSFYFEPQLISTADLDSNLDRKVTVSGKVLSVFETDKIVILEVANQRTASVLIFKRDSKPFVNASGIKVSGMIRLYKGKPELVADRFEVLNVSC